MLSHIEFWGREKNGKEHELLVVLFGIGGLFCCLFVVMCWAGVGFFAPVASKAEYILCHCFIPCETAAL